MDKHPCPVCRKPQRVNADGSVRKHDRDTMIPGRKVKCEGSGQPAATPAPPAG